MNIQTIPCRLGRLLAVISCLSIAPAGAWAESARLPGPKLVIPESCGVQLKNYTATVENLDEIAGVGFKAVRRGFVWANIEKAPGEYQFDEYDRLVDDCEKRGLLVLGCIALNNKAFPGVKDPEGRKAFAEFAARVVERYKGRPVIWEIWNEPNISSFWGKHGKANTDAFADEYFALVKEVAPAMRKANPEAVILAGSVNLYEASFAWMERCFQNGILETGIDGWSIHPYSTKSPEGHLDYYARIREMMQKHGKTAEFPLVNSERGYPIGKAEGYAGGDPALSKEYQAWHFVRQYLSDVMAGVRLTIWYEWGGKEGFGLLANGEKSPALEAARVMISQLKGFHLEERIPTGSDRDYVLRFVNDSGAVKIVAWTAPAAGESPDKTMIHEVAIPVAATGTLETATIYGEKGSLPVEEGKVKVTLSGSPQYLTVKN